MEYIVDVRSSSTCFGNGPALYFPVTYYEHAQPIYVCFVNNIVIIEQNSEKIKITGTHERNKTNQDVDSIFISNGQANAFFGYGGYFQAQLLKFPGGFGKIFVNLKYFKIRNSLIKTLSKEDFLHLEHLQGLWLEECFIVSLPGDLFNNVQRLRHLSFYKNKLKYIGRDLLKPLKDLQQADFRKNITIDMKMSNDEQLAVLNYEIATKCIPTLSLE